MSDEQEFFNDPPALEDLKECPECGGLFSHPASCKLAKQQMRERPNEWAIYDPETAKKVQP